MIKREMLLNKISTLLELESALLPLIREQVSSTLFFSRLPEDARSVIQQEMQAIADKGQKHIALLKELKTSVKDAKTNIF